MYKLQSFVKLLQVIHQLTENYQKLNYNQVIGQSRGFFNSLEEYGLLIKYVSETIKNEAT